MASKNCVDINQTYDNNSRRMNNSTTTSSIELFQSKHNMKDLSHISSENMQLKSAKIPR